MGELRDRDDLGFRDIELTEDTFLRAWRQIPDGRTVIEILEEDASEPHEEDRIGVIARLFLDDTGRKQLVAALTVALPENEDPCATCCGQGGPVMVKDGDEVVEHDVCPECGVARYLTGRP